MIQTSVSLEKSSRTRIFLFFFFGGGGGVGLKINYPVYFFSDRISDFRGGPLEI